MPAIRRTAVAGRFYPGEASALAAEVAAYLAEAGPARAHAPKAIIAPHAGYMYSGAIAGSAYARLAPLAGKVARVVLAGPAHRVYVRGAAIPFASAFDSPLGAVELDAAALAELRRLPFVEVSDAAHALEHSLEVHLPFLQAVLGSFRLVPVVMGDASREEAARLFDAVWGGDETLIVVSSDLSHYLPYEAARVRDRATAEAIVGLDPCLDSEEACGAAPINGLLAAARSRGLGAELVDLRSSGDTAGDRDRVVGYGAFAFTAAARPRGEMAEAADRGALLVAIAREAIEREPPPGASFGDAPWLRENGASFVTLKLGGELRGCIGTIDARRALGEDVARNARAAAYRDPRFPPVRDDERPALAIEVSVLSTRVPFAAASEAEALAQLRPGVDGVYLQYEDMTATFLPQVWENLTDPLEFLAALRQKAGLPARFWNPGVRLSRYTAEKYK